MIDYVSLGEIAEIKGGGTPDKKVAAYWNGDIPWASVKDFKSGTLDRTVDRITSAGVAASATQIIPAGHIIVPTRMAVGKAAINTIDLAINQDLKALFPKSHVATRYLYHALLANSAKLIDQATGATVKGIKLDALRGLQIPLPPLEEQKRIAGILDQADALRRLRTRALDKLNTLGQAIFHEMFGDPRIRPNRWLNVGFDEACKDETSRSPKVQKVKYVEVGDIPVIDQGQKEIAGYTDEENACRSQSPVVVFGDHTKAVKYIDFKFAIGADGAKVLRPSELYEPIFFAILLKNLPIPDLGYSRHMREVKKLRFPAPPRPLQKAFADRIEALVREETKLRSSQAKLSNLFASLQHRAFRGEL